MEAGVHLFDKFGETERRRVVAEGDAIECQSGELVDRVDERVQIDVCDELDLGARVFVETEHV